jgi:hypothetical protein
MAVSVSLYLTVIPAHPNWLETAGHREGTMCWRWYRLKEGVKPVEPVCQVVKVQEWKNSEQQ